MENETYRLRQIESGDRDNYMRTVIVNSNVPGMCCVPGFADTVWNETPGEGELIFCIYEKVSDTYCGFCNVRGIGTETPEVGMSLLPEFQGKGIGQQALQLMIEMYLSRHTAKYFIARVDSRNQPSLRLMKKIGASQFQVEDSEYKQGMEQLRSLCERMGAEDILNSEEYEFPKDDSYICVFRIPVAK